MTAFFSPPSENKLAMSESLLHRDSDVHSMDVDDFLESKGIEEADTAELTSKLLDSSASHVNLMLCACVVCGMHYLERSHYQLKEGLPCLVMLMGAVWVELISIILTTWVRKYTLNMTTSL